MTTEQKQNNARCVIKIKTELGLTNDELGGLIGISARNVYNKMTISKDPNSRFFFNDDHVSALIEGVEGKQNERNNNVKTIIDEYYRRTN
jgi:hypothetical protein